MEGKTNYRTEFSEILYKSVFDVEDSTFRKDIEERVIV
ncbi:hypothetical protein STRDD10_00239 [Streptococcus sp. DD10]|nr:hypothetical protein STRDD10_00239 [Streptococcus sp. DD10]